MQQITTQQVEASFVNLTNAQPAQGMNRSTDQVRASMRAYVDDGRITDEQLESIVRFFVQGKQRNLSFDGIARLIDYSGSTVSRLFAGKYEGALDDVVEGAVGREGRRHQPDRIVVRLRLGGMRQGLVRNKRSNGGQCRSRLEEIPPVH